MYYYTCFCHNPKDPFLEFDLRSHAKPQFLIPNSRYERPNELYFSCMAEKVKYISTYPMRLSCVIFCWQSGVRAFQFIYSLTVNPRKLNMLDCGVIYHRAWDIILRYGPFTVMECNKLSVMYIGRKFAYGRQLDDFVHFWINEYANGFNISITLTHEWAHWTV